MRIHATERSALWFGPAPGRPAIHRFDDPAGSFGVCYLGTNLDVCFAETFLRNPPVRIVALDDLAGRSVSTFEVRRQLRLVPVCGLNLARLGVTAELASGSDYAVSQEWSRVLWEHKESPDGILYRSRHDDSAFCIALYNRAKDALVLVENHSLTEDPQRLARLLRRYGVGLTN
jgi:hypothetical protein